MGRDGDRRRGPVSPGATVGLSATLEPGAYLVACPLLDGGQLARGMLTLSTIGIRALTAVATGTAPDVAVETHLVVDRDYSPAGKL